MKPNSLFKIPIPKSKWSRQLVMALVGVGLLAGVAYTSYAASIGVSFIGRNGGDDLLGPTDTAGVDAVSQPWWRNINEVQPDGTFTGYEAALWDNTGKFTAISLDYAATDSWSSDGPTTTPNHKLMKGIIKAVRNNDNTGNRNDPATFKINGLPAGGVYDVYVYIIENGTGAQGSVELGTVTNFIAVQNSFNGTFVQAASTIPGTYIDANYAKFSNVSIDAQGVIQITVRKDNPGSNYGGANDGVGVAGIQIVQVSGPAFPPNTDSCLILTQPPATASAFDGASVSASVGTMGPCFVQWKKNGVDIAGATTTSLTLPVTVADNNAQITAVLSNNVNSVTSTPMVLSVLAANKGIGFSFIGRGTPATLAPDESAGLVGQKNWFNIPVEAFSGTSELLAADGNTTMVQLTFAGSDSWNSGGGTATPNEKLMKGILKCNPSTDTAVPTDGSDTIRLTVTNLPTGTYKVILYVAENDATGNNRALADVTLGSTTYYSWEQCVFGGTFIRCASTTFGNYEPDGGGNYIQFDNVTPTAGGTIAINLTKVIELPQVTDGCGIAGVQLIQLTGNGYPTNSLPVVIKTDPQPTVAAAGKPATFNVVASGPFIRYQWKKNGVDIPGATSSQYTFVTALADNGAQFRVLVWNNFNILSSLDATLTVDVPTPAQLTQGWLEVDRYENIGGNTGTQGITDTINAINAGGFPTTIFGAAGPNVPNSSPDISNFGCKVWGWLKPDVSGNYTFFTRSDDSSAVYLNPVAAASGTNSLPVPGVDPIICHEDGCCNAFLEPPAVQASAAAFPLEAGKLYGFVALYKEGGGGDFLQVAWRLDTDPTPAASLTPIPATNCYMLASSSGHRVNLVQQPKPVSVIEGNPAAFTLGVEVQPATDNYIVQWLTNGVPVPGVTGPRYAINSTALVQNGLQVKARVLSPFFGEVDTTTVTLTVLADTFPPVPKSGVIALNAGGNQVGVGFDEAVNPADLVPANFTFVGPAGSSGTFRVVTNSLDTYHAVVFDTAGLTAGATGKVTVKNVRDLKGNAIPAAGVDATFAVTDFGFADTGAPIRPGQVVPVGSDGFDVLNGGRQEWNSYDEATIAYQQKTGDFDVKVRVMYAEPASQWARCGLMARNSLNAGEASGDGRGGANPNVSAFAQTHVNPAQTLASSGVWAAYDPAIYAQPQNPTPNNGHEQNCRLATGATTSGWGSAGTPPTYPNAWLRLARVGTTINGYRSEDGVNWTSQGSVTLTTQQPTMYVGPFFAVETGNIWATGVGVVPPSGFDIWQNPFDPLYDRLFVANFRDFGPAVGSASAIKFGIIQDPVGKGDLVLIWTSGGVLQQSTSVGGPWTAVVGAPSSASGGRFEVAKTGSAMFFRVKVQ